MHIVDTDMMTVVSKKLPLSNPIRRDYIDDRNDRKEELNEIIGNIDGDFEITLELPRQLQEAHRGTTKPIRH